MLGFYCNVFNDNQVNLIVQNFTGEEAESILAGESTAAFITDSIEAAMEHFNIYEDHGMLKRHVESELALQALDVEPEEVDDFREKINTIIQAFDDEAAVENAILYPKWAANKAYTANEKVRYEGVLYKVLQDHTSQSTWTPDAAPSLFARVLIEDPDVVPEWTQPDSTNGYSTGDKVTHNGHTWISTADNNIWEPGATGAPWELFGEEEETTEPEIEPWEQKSYMIGDRVLFEGATYESLIDNNVWSPSAYPAGWQLITE